MSTAVVPSTTVTTPIVYNDDVIETHTARWSETQKEAYADYVASQRLDYEPTIKMGDRVVIESGEKILITHMKPNVTIPVRGKQVKVESLIDQPLNSTFCWENDTFKRRLEGKVDIEAVFAEVEEKELDKDFMPTLTNKDLIASQHNQTMTAEQIEHLKDSDMSATDIIRQVTGGSSTWEGKTEFSQLKWLKKKWAKYNKDVTVRTPTPFVLRTVTGGTESVTQKDHMRDDTYAQILAMANIGHDMRCIVIDSTDGLISAAVQRRMGDSGGTLCLHTGRAVQQGMLDLNLTQNQRGRLVTLPIDALPSYGWANNSHGYNAYQRQLIEEQKPQIKAQFPRPTEVLFPTMGLPAQNFLQHKALSAIVCHWTYDPLSLLLPVLPFLLPSSPIVLWCPSIEPLVAAMNFLQTHSLATQLHLQDTWYRPLQVLPNRTHPHMNMEATGGFLLYGFTLDYFTQPAQPTTATATATTTTTSTTPVSHLHPSFQRTNNAYNYTPILPPERAVNNKEHFDNFDGSKKRKWQHRGKANTDTQASANMKD